jgi:hypothetical protein
MMRVDVDVTNFVQVNEELARKLNAPDDTVMREETGKILSKAIENTDAADVGKIRSHSANAKFSLQPITLYTPKHRGVIKAKSADFSGRVRILYNLSYRYPNELWSAIQAARARDVAVRIAARGLAKQSWYRIGQMLGVSVDAPSYVKKAVARTGKTYPNDETARSFRENGKIGIEFDNSQPTVNAIGGAQALQRAIDGRVQFYLTNLSHGVFMDLQAIAKKYPGVEITQDG